MANTKKPNAKSQSGKKGTQAAKPEKARGEKLNLWMIVIPAVVICLVLVGVFVPIPGLHKKSNDDSGNQAINPEKNPIVTITMDTGKEIKVELYPTIAPNTVYNFISLVKNKFYDGLTFHRVIPEFMIQGGDPYGNGAGGPGYSIKGEFESNGISNTLLHTRGVISMARSNDPNSGGSQFFIMVADSPNLDGDYAAFGKVISGMEEVDRIVNVERDGNDKPLQQQTMKQVTVETFGTKYPEPEKI